MTQTTDLITYVDMLAQLHAGDEPYRIDLALGTVQTQYQTWNITIPEEALSKIRLEET